MPESLAVLQVSATEPPQSFIRSATGTFTKTSDEVAEIGRSREGRPIFGAVLGDGPLRISLIAGAHADEPVGPATLAKLCYWLSSSDDARPLLERATWHICPHVNPDGAERNAAWSDSTPFVLREYLANAVRERPGDDVEFGFPRDLDDDNDARPENIAVARFLQGGAPYDFHASLHGMFIAEGAWFLINREKRDATAQLRRDLADVAEGLGIGLHDWDRRGEKGFTRIERGFSTTPTSVAMREHFEALGDLDEAAKFRPSSMETIASFGGDPLCMVSEMPLFRVRPTPPSSDVLGANFLTLKDALPGAVAELAAGRPSALDQLEAQYGLEPVDVDLGSRVQLEMIFRGSGILETRV
jgi:hypothetical protein